MKASHSQVPGTEMGQPSFDGRISRRRLLAGGAQGIAAFGGMSLLAACGAAGTSPGTASTAAAGKPKRGGTITLGMITGGSSETIVPALVINNPDLVRVPQLFDPLFRVSEDIKTLVPMLATGATANPNATKWTLQIRDGVRWHDGKRLSADDVIWTIQNSWQSPINVSHGQIAGVIDFAGVRKRGPLAVEIPLLIPVAEFPTLLTFFNLYIVQNGATTASIKAAPVGTGPFKYKSFTPAQQSVFEANKEYWEEGKPYVDRLVVDSSFTDETARQNALVSGQINVSGSIPGVIAKEAAGNSAVDVMRAHGANWYEIDVRIDKAPFTDNRVRQALRLIADRPAIIESGLNGYGTVGRDLTGEYCEYFAWELTRHQDLEQAKALLKAAGQEGLTFKLPVSEAAPGFVECATVYAAQAKAAGVTVIIDQIPSANYFSQQGGYLTRSTTLDVGASSYPSLTMAYRLQYRKGAPYNDTYWGYQPGGAAADALLNQAIAATEPAKAEQLWLDVQRRQFEEGGALVFAMADYLDAKAPTVHGLQTTKAGYLNNWRLLDGWLE